jgi:hypothetical protein
MLGKRWTCTGFVASYRVAVVLKITCVRRSPGMTRKTNNEQSPTLPVIKRPLSRIAPSSIVVAPIE